MYTWTDLLLLRSLQTIWKSEHVTFSRMLSLCVLLSFRQMYRTDFIVEHRHSDHSLNPGRLSMEREICP